MPNILEMIDKFLNLKFAGELTVEVVCFRLILAIILGGIVGYEREKNNRPAGFRTHILVCFGAAIVSMIQDQLRLNILDIARTEGSAVASVIKTDLGRLGAQVISGVGFLGAGSIMKEKGETVGGLTTAAGIWATACVGLGIGWGFYNIAIVAILFMIIIMVSLKRVESKFVRKPGTAIVGYGIIDYDKNKYSIVDYGVVLTSKDLSTEERLEIVYDEIDKILKKYKPEFMAIEDLFYFKNNKTVISVAQARGVILLAGKQNNIAMTSYTPLQVKIGITGYGKAEKKQVQQMVQKFLGLSEIPKPDDVADALAICITHINSLGSKLSFGGANNLKKVVVPSGTNKISLEEYKNLLKK